MPVTTALSFLPGALANDLIVSPVPFTIIGAVYTGESAIGSELSTVKWMAEPGVALRKTTAVSPSKAPGFGNNRGSAVTPSRCVSAAAALSLMNSRVVSVLEATRRAATVRPSFVRCGASCIKD